MKHRITDSELEIANQFIRRADEWANRVDDDAKKFNMMLNVHANVSACSGSDSVWDVSFSILHWPNRDTSEHMCINHSYICNTQLKQSIIDRIFDNAEVCYTKFIEDIQETDSMYKAARIQQLEKELKELKNETEKGND